MPALAGPGTAMPEVAGPGTAMPDVAGRCCQVFLSCVGALTLARGAPPGVWPLT